MVDDEDLQRFFLWGELEAEGLECSEEGGGFFVVVVALKDAHG